MLQMLLSNGADINAKTRNGSTALYIAINHSNTSMAQMLLQQGADPLNSTSTSGSSGLTCVHAAAKIGHQELVTKLIKAGADPHATDSVCRHLLNRLGDL